MKFCLHIVFVHCEVDGLTMCENIMIKNIELHTPHPKTLSEEQKKTKILRSNWGSDPKVAVRAGVGRLTRPVVRQGGVQLMITITSQNMKHPF